MNFKKLHLDFETYSELDISKVGAHKYLLHYTAEPLMVSWCLDKGPVQLIDFTEFDPAILRWMFDEIRKGNIRDIYRWAVDTIYRTIIELVHYILDPTILIYAFNANFERLVLKYLFGINLHPSRFRCVMAHAWHLSFSGGLAAVGEQMGLPSDKKKDARGKKLIQMFCCPNPKNYKISRYTKEHKPEEWIEFKEYCIQDTESERYMDHLLMQWPMPEQEQKLWEMNEIMNDRGVPIDVPMVNNVIRIRDMEKHRMMKELRDLTGLENPNSRDQMLGWLTEQGIQMDNLQAETVAQKIQELSRHLMYHLESDCFFEVFDEKDLEEALMNNCDDVTGIPQLERQFKEREL